MKWLKSTTQKSWVASCKGKQIIIPQNETRDNKWLQLGDDEYAEVAGSPVIASLIKAGSILVLNEEPAELKNTIPSLQIANNQLNAELETAKARIVELEAQLKDATHVDIEAIKAEAVAAKQKELEELDARASALIEEKDATIKKLEKKIKKLGGDASEE